MKKLLRKIFLYEEPRKKYSFTIPENPDEAKKISEKQYIEGNLLKKNVSTILQKNIDFLTVQYNSLINSDIIMRHFTINIYGRSYKAMFFGIDGMMDSQLINNYLLKPLMLPKNKNYINDINKKAIKVKLEDYLYNKLIPQNNVKRIKDFQSIVHSINSGDGALFVDGLGLAFVIDVKGYKSRAVSTPKNEIVVRGAQESFVEKIRTNTSMLRRLINSENLVIENAQAGKISKTPIAICYMKNIANDNLVGEVKYRINNLQVDYIISSGQLEQFIQDNNRVAFPQMIATERPDKAANHLLEGRVVVLVNGSPYSLIMPGIFVDFLSSPEDFNLRYQYSNLLRMIRVLATLITLLLPRYLCCYDYLSCRINTN